MQQATLSVLGAQVRHQLDAQKALGGPERFGVPFPAFAIVDRDEGRLAALRQAHVEALQVGVDARAERIDGVPLRVGVWQGDARRFPDALHRHAVLERGLAVVDRAADRCRRRRLGRAGERDMSFAGVQARGRIEADPAGAGQIDLAPGMQVGEIDFGAARAVERLHVALQLDQVARDEARRQAQVAQQLHQQPAAVAARAAAVDERELGRLHARLHADEIRDVLLQALIQADQKTVGGLRLDVDAGQVLGEARRLRALQQIRLQLDQQLRLVGERKLLGARLEEEVERIEHRHLGDEIDLDAKEGRHLREHQPRQVVRLRVLLPVDEVRARLDAHRIAEDARARMRRRPQPNDLRAEMDRPVVAVVGDVVERDVDRHQGFRKGRPRVAAVTFRLRAPRERGSRG